MRNNITIWRQMYILSTLDVAQRGKPIKNKPFVVSHWLCPVESVLRINILFNMKILLGVPCKEDMSMTVQYVPKV